MPPRNALIYRFGDERHVAVKEIRVATRRPRPDVTRGDTRRDRPDMPCWERSADAVPRTLPPRDRRSVLGEAGPCKRAVTSRLSCRVEG
jgi:hypothetical protein